MDYGKFKGGGNFAFLPKVGEQEVFSIAKMSFGKSNDDKWNFSKSVTEVVDGKKKTWQEIIPHPETGEPFNLRCELTDGKVLSVSSFCAFMQVFKKGDVQDGDKIKVSHPEKGKWLVEKIGKIEPDAESIPF